MKREIRNCPELATVLETARHHGMSPTEIEAERRRWCIAELMRDDKELTEAAANALYDEAGKVETQNLGIATGGAVSGPLPLVGEHVSGYPLPVDQSAENIFGKVPGRFDEAAAVAAQRSIEQTLISSFFALPPERIGSAVAAFNEAQKPRCGRPGWMIVPTGGAAVAATDTPSPVDRSGGDPDAVELAYRAAFEDGEKHAAEALADAQSQAHTYKLILDELTSKGVSKAIFDVTKERRRQMAVEGWTIEHDDQHQQDELAWAAACYALASAGGNPAAAVISREDIPHALWPWALQWFKPTERRRDLVKAAALIIAEIERLDRLSQNQSMEPQS